MQIMPSFFQENPQDIAPVSSSSSVKEDSAFARLFSNALNKQDQEEAFSDAEWDQSATLSAYMLSSPYNPTPEILSPFAPQPVRFTSKEMNALADAMGKDKVSPFFLKAVRDSGKRVNGPSVEDLLKDIQKAAFGEEPSFSKEETLMLENLAMKMGMDPKAFAETDLQSMLASFRKGLDSMQGTITLDKEEALLLAKALRLTDNTAKGIEKTFEGADAIALNKQSFAQLFGAGIQEADTRLNDTEKALTSLQKNLSSILADATKREEMERMGSMRESRLVNQRKVLIEDSATKAAPGREEEAQEGQNAKSMRNSADNPSAKPVDSAIHGKQENAPVLEKADKKAEPLQKTKEALNAALQKAENTGNNEVDKAEGPRAPIIPPVASRQSQENGDNAGKESAEDKKRNAEKQENFAAQLNRKEEKNTSTDSAEKKVFTPSAGESPVAPLGMVQGPATQNAAFTAQQAVGRAGTSPEAQISEAMLTAAKNGTQKLELQLNPENLGVVTVTLISRNGEISALIQPEKAETAALVNRQLEAIRAQLENQGVRLEKIDVQTSLADSHSQNSESWSNAEQHNSAREWAQRTHENEHNRRLLQAATADTSILAQDMQDTGIEGKRENYAERLHLVA